MRSARGRSLLSSIPLLTTVSYAGAAVFRYVCVQQRLSPR